MPSYITGLPSQLPKTNPMAEDASAALVYSWLSVILSKVEAAAIRAEQLTFSGLDDGQSVADLLHTLAIDLASAESRAQLALTVYNQRAALMAADPSNDAGARRCLKDIERQLANIRASIVFSNRIATQTLQFPAE